MTVLTTTKTGVDILNAPRGVWTTLVRSSMPPGTTEVHALFYVNFSGVVVPDMATGAITIRALRDGTVDETSLQDFTLHKRRNGTFRQKVSHPWFGAQTMRSLHWQYLVDAESVVSASIKGTYYAKAMDN